MFSLVPLVYVIYVQGGQQWIEYGALWDTRHRDQPPVDGHLPVSDNGNDLLNSLEKFDNLFREQLDKIKNINKGNKPPLIHVLGDFNFRDIVWPDRLSKSGSSLSQTEGQILIDIMNDHGLEQLVNFPTRERNSLDLILGMSTNAEIGIRIFA